MRIHGKIDKNQHDVVLALRKAGAKVLILSDLGKGCPDLAVGFRGNLILMEVKAKGGRLTPDELFFYDNWCEYMVVVYSVEDALKAVGVI
jgi:hypothetical protein